MQADAYKFEFLIRLDDRHFLAEISARAVTGSPVLSSARPLDYRGAFRICHGLKLHGYPAATICDMTGRPLTVDTFG